MMKHAISIIIIAIATLAHADPVTLSGITTDATTGEPLGFATIAVKSARYATHADADGRWALRLPAGNYTITASYIGYRQLAANVTATSDSVINIRLQPLDRKLNEVVVTAKESNGFTSGSRIDRDAMNHLQPTSFTDLLELLPGNISKTPDMSRTNTITLRETGNIGASGAISDNPDYAITSLGTAFVVDGAPINTDADLQEVPGATSGDASYRRSTVNRGVDMRSISTDNIESVEIIRGIPSAEYGNLTSGVVNIRRQRRATPLSARFKADEYSKLFSLGKGFGIKSTEHVINADAGYLDSKADPRNNLENYKRVNGSIRANMRFRSHSMLTIWNAGIDYTGSFDDTKIDPDLNYSKIDEYKRSYHRGAFTSDLTISPAGGTWLKTVNLSTSISYVDDRLYRHKQVTANGTPLAPTSMEEGVHDGQYITGTYMADFKLIGRPLSVFTKLRASGNAGNGSFTHSYKAGMEWSMTKNYGDGQIYDLLRPLSGGWTTRPRAFNDIPALHILSVFAENSTTALLGSNRLELQIGARMQMLPSLDGKYYLSGRPYVDPRINVVWNFPAIEAGNRPLQILLAGGYGLTTKMPTVDYLFPQVNYSDFVQLGYFDVRNPQEYSRVNLRTYITDPTNYDLRAARNNKWELRMGVDWGGNRMSVTYFEEKLNSGFRYSTVYDTFAYRRYDASAINPSELTGPPSLEGLPYEDRRILDGYSKVTNGTRIDKRGIEFQINTVRWQALRTSLTVTGAWFHTRYSNSQMLYKPVSIVIGNTAISDRYVGLYDTADGRTNDQFNTNFMFDTQIPRWGLIFTTTIQCMWWVKSHRLHENGIPVSYLSADDGALHPYTDADASDAMLQHLIFRYGSELYDTNKVPIAMYFNLKATKQIGRHLRISAFVNRIIDYLPDYTSNGITVRRSSDAYFGMEATLTI